MPSVTYINTTVEMETIRPCRKFPSQSIENVAMHSCQSHLIERNIVVAFLKDGTVIIHVRHNNADAMIHLEGTWKT